MNKIKVHFIINTLSGGGAEKVLCDLLKVLDPQKYELSLSTIAGGVHEKDVPEYCKKRIYSRLNTLKAKIIFRLPIFILSKLLVDTKADINVAYLEGLPTKALAHSRVKGKKISFIHFDVSSNNLFEHIYKTIDSCKKDYRKIDKVCFVSKDALDGFSSKYGYASNYLVVHNVIDYGEVKRKSAETTSIRFLNNVFKIVVVGRLTSAKNIFRVLNIASLYENDYKFQIIVVGDGPDYKKLVEIKKEKNINSVSFVKYQENPYPIIKQADLLLCTSNFEGYSTVACEALALGIPLLTTKCAGMDEITQGGKMGVIVENTDEAIAQGFEAILSNEALYKLIKSNADTYSKTLPAINKNEYDALFESLLEDK